MIQIKLYDIRKQKCILHIDVPHKSVYMMMVLFDDDDRRLWEELLVVRQNKKNNQNQDNKNHSFVVLSIDIQFRSSDMMYFECVIIINNYLIFAREEQKNKPVCGVRAQ